MRYDSRIPNSIRSNLSEELRDMRVAGVDLADVDESCRLYGPPGCGKSTQSSIRSAVRAVEDGLHPIQMTVATYRKSLAGAVKENMREWGVFDGVEQNDFKYWTTIHAAASRATNFHDRFPPKNNCDEHEGMVGDNEKYHFCNLLGIKKKPNKPWQETRWTVFYDLYTYCKNNLLNIGKYPEIDESVLKPVENDLLADEKIKKFREHWEATNIEDVVEMWEAYKQDHNCYDFYEQLTAALNGPLPPMKHVVIDEYHDATPLMAAVAERWVENADTAIVAGDPDQVVNSYAGASPGFFEEIGGRVRKEMPVVRLDESYRVSNEHYQAAARVLSEERTPPQLSTSGAGMLNEWKSHRFDSKKKGWRTPAVDKQGSPAHLWDEFGPDIMFLARTQRRCKAVCSALDDYGVIYESQPDVGQDWETLLGLLNALKLLSNVSPPRDEGTVVNETLTDTGDGKFENYALGVDKVELLSEYTSGHLQDGLDGFLGSYDSGNIQLDELESLLKQKWWRLHTKGVNSIASLTGLSDDQKAAMQAAADRYWDDLPAVTDVETRVLTMHASKGSEASNVVVFDGITTTIKDSIERSNELSENEARTWYVALTRAQDRLHIVRDAFSGHSYLPDDLCQSAYHSARQQRGV